MADLTIISWLDIPAQVVAKRGRQSARRELPPRFAGAIDMAAMRSGAHDDQSYRGEWQRGDPAACEDDLEEAADAASSRLNAERDRKRLLRLVSTGGRES